MKRISVAILLLLVFVRLAHGATYYIDPTCQYNGDGTTPNCATAVGGVGAFNTGMGIDATSGNTYLWKRGTVDVWDDNLTRGKRFDIKNVDNVTLGAYGEGPKPIIEEYSQVPAWTANGTNLYYYELPETYQNPPYLIGVGALTTNGTMATNPSSWGDWNSWEYAHEGVNRLYIYSEEDPKSFYGPVFYSTHMNQAVWIENANNITISDLELRYNAGIYVLASLAGNYTNIKIHNCVFRDCFRGIYLICGYDISSGKRFVQPEIFNNTFYRTRGTPIYVAGSNNNVRIWGNRFYDCGLEKSIAGVYITKARLSSWEEGADVHDNVCYRFRQGRYYDNDGSCFYIEEESNNTKVYNNWCYDSSFCIIDHSSKSVRIWNNFSLRCKCGLRSAQSADYGTAVKEIYNNTFAQCGTSGPLGTVDYGFCVRLWAPSTNSFIFRNNIINVTVPTQVAIEIGPQSWSAITESNNAIYGSYTHRFWQSMNGEKSLTNPVLADVGLKTYVIDRSSPAVDAGVNVPIREADVLGHKIVDGKPDIGAYEALSIPTPSETPILF